MNTSKVILATLVIFIAGLVTGAVLVRQSSWVRRAVRPPVTRPGGPGTPGIMRVEFLRRLQRELDLSPEQKERIEKILKEGQEESRRIMEPVMPELRQQFSRTKDQFREVLTPEQRRKFDELVRHPQHSREKRRQGPQQSPLPAPPPVSGGTAQP